ncbi:MAG: 2-amino-4-hydroxy-6-hydroxymethyldihydropteridine diphosphokinase [Aquificaceae bacterium]|nr:MAG: 2-amino-4-hydroxy-6-hydroxymethyldihydropteridine diphosphokinase [Aquificaceae bacterium]
MSICYIGLGSNLGDSIAYLDNAVDSLRASQAITHLSLSHFYRSKPHGPQNQPDYINAVARFETSIDPHALLSLLQKIENNNDRQRNGERWGARTLDLDLLLYGNMIIDSETLIVPHPYMRERSFVLYPLQELAPDLVFPDGETLANSISRLALDDLELIKRG